MKRYAIPPNGCELYLTAGKKYEVRDENERMFYVIADDGGRAYCCKQDCTHAGGDWTFVDEPDDAPADSTPATAPRLSDVRNDGGPAFACAACNGHQEGMSLRDWFAGMAMQGIVSCLEYTCGKDESAKHAYQYADAMLKQKGAK